MKILHISYSTGRGGAGIAAFRLHEELLKNGVDSSFLCIDDNSSNNNIIKINIFLIFIIKFYSKINYFLFKKYDCNGSINIFPTFFNHWINKSDFDIIHLHWIGSNMVSICDLSNIKKKIVWTFHDIWPISNVEHYMPYNNFIEDYSINITRFSVSKFLWHLKIKMWSKMSFCVVCPSNFIYKYCISSNILKNSKIFVIKNLIDTSAWSPINKIDSRCALGFSNNDNILLFASNNNFSNVNKNYNGILKILSLLSELTDKNFKLITFGGANKRFNISKISDNIEIIHFGRVEDKSLIKKIYSSADLVIIPSFFESLSNVALESLSSGRPVISFDIEALKDLIIDGYNGFLIKQFNYLSFASKIKYFFDLDMNSRNQFEFNSRDFTNLNFNEVKIVNEHLLLYKSLLSTSNC